LGFAHHQQGEKKMRKTALLSLLLLATSAFAAQRMVLVELLTNTS
jgi:hypothetical protein